MEAIAAVQARIHEIQSAFGVAPPGGTGGAFASALATAVEATETTAAPARTGKLVPPPELARFGNGRIPASALTPIGEGSHRLHAPAAEAFKALKSAAAADGVKIGITDSYRSHDAQVDLAKRKGLYSQGGLAATPGTSNHGWGMSVDLDLDATAQRWMRQNAGRFGFVEDVPREPWHWTFRPKG